MPVRRRCPLDVYDPRLRDRKFKLSDEKLWNSSRQGLVFFETGSYGCFTDHVWLGRVLETLIKLKSPSVLVVTTTHYRGSLAAPGIEARKLPNGGAEFRLEPGCVGALMRLFDDYANYGIWNFYGSDSQPFRRLPEVLMRCERFPFFIELDLDAVLMGFIHPGADLDRVVLELQQLE